LSHRYNYYYLFGFLEYKHNTLLKLYHFVPLRQGYAGQHFLLVFYVLIFIQYGACATSRKALCGVRQREAQRKNDGRSVVFLQFGSNSFYQKFLKKGRGPRYARHK
jgi:hypothetical protein